MTATKNTKRIKSLERKAKDAGLDEKKLDVSILLKMVYERYGLPYDGHPVWMKESTFKKLIEKALQTNK